MSEVRNLNITAKDDLNRRCLNEWLCVGKMRSHILLATVIVMVAGSSGCSDPGGGENES